MLRVATGPLALKPDEFWRMTPAEFAMMQEGYLEREKSKHDYIVYHAWLTANLMRKRKLPTLERVLQPRKKDTRTVEEKRAEWESLKRQFGVM